MSNCGDAQRLRGQRPNDEKKIQHGMGAYSKIIVGKFACGIELLHIL